MCDKKCKDCYDFFTSSGTCGNPMTTTVSEEEGHKNIKTTAETKACGFFNPIKKE